MMALFLFMSVAHNGLKIQHIPIGELVGAFWVNKKIMNFSVYGLTVSRSTEREKMCLVMHKTSVTQLI